MYISTDNLHFHKQNFKNWQCVLCLKLTISTISRKLLAKLTDATTLKNQMISCFRISPPLCLHWENKTALSLNGIWKSELFFSLNVPLYFLPQNTCVHQCMAWKLKKFWEEGLNMWNGLTTEYVNQFADLKQ